MSNTSYTLKSVSDQDLICRLKTLVRRDQALSAEVLAHLAEVDTRGLYLGEAAPSLFAYCVEVLHLSEDAAYKRIQAARAARAYPVIFELIATGALHLAAVNLLAPHLTEENHQELLTTARHQSKRQVELLVASRFPRPDARFSLRQLPMRAAATSPLPSNGPTAPVVPSVPVIPSAPVTAPRAVADESAAPAGAFASHPIGSPTHAHGERGRLSPLAADRFRLQVTLSAATRDRLLRAQELLRHKHPDGDVAAILDLALRELCERLERQKFGKLKAPAAFPISPSTAAPVSPSVSTSVPVSASASTPALTSSATSAPTSATDSKRGRVTEVAPGQPQPETTDLPGPHPTRPAPPGPPAPGDSGRAPADGTSRHIGRGVRRMVAERDKYQCTFVAPDGRRCKCRERLEFHHIEPFACGGGATVENTTLRCRAHNMHQAVLDFGLAAVRRGIEASARRRHAP